MTCKWSHFPFIPQSNQIRVVAFNVPQLTQASFLQKKSNVAKCFFDISSTEIAQCCQKLDVILVKFIYSEKATKFCEIFPLLLTVCTVVKCKGKISQNFVAFSEYMNFNLLDKTIQIYRTWLAGPYLPQSHLLSLGLLCLQK